MTSSSSQSLLFKVGNLTKITDIRKQQNMKHVVRKGSNETISDAI